MKSLNYSFRKKEGMKIVEENKRLMQRLERTSSTFRNKEAYLRDFKKYLLILIIQNLGIKDKDLEVIIIK